MTTTDITQGLLPSVTHHGIYRHVNTGPVATLQRLRQISPTPTAAVQAAAGGLGRSHIADRPAATGVSPARPPQCAPAPAPPMPTRPAGTPRR